MTTHTNSGHRIEGLIEEGEAFTRLNTVSTRATRKRPINTKLVMSVTAALYGIFGSGWLIIPDVMGKYWRITPGDGLNYMGHRYGAFMLGLVVALWLARNTPNTEARRAVLMGALVTTVLTTAVSVCGALTLDLNAWPAVITESLLAMGLICALFIRPEPIVKN